MLLNLGITISTNKIDAEIKCKDIKNTKANETSSNFKFCIKSVF